MINIQLWMDVAASQSHSQRYGCPKLNNSSSPLQQLGIGESVQSRSWFHAMTSKLEKASYVMTPHLLDAAFLLVSPPQVRCTAFHWRQFIVSFVHDCAKVDAVVALDRCPDLGGSKSTRLSRFEVMMLMLQQGMRPLARVRSLWRQRSKIFNLRTASASVLGLTATCWMFETTISSCEPV